MHNSIAWLARGLSTRSVDSLVAAYGAGRTTLDGGLARFWARHRAGRPLTDLSALIKADLRHHFEQGERPAASAYLDQFPELVEDGDRVLSLVYEEFCLLDERQAGPSVADFCQRYDRWKDSIASQLGYHHKFSQVVATERPEVRYPAVGERFANYQLCSVLGQGGTAQVYLATDSDLGGREVALKLTSTLGLEPSILASLEHRNIVPIHSVSRPEGSALQGICMPYRPGITLDKLLVQLLASGPPRRARLIWELLGLDRLDREQVNLAWRDFPTAGTYIEAVAWLGLEMARALAYLHSRGVYHRDVKPANILLSARGGPFLIDFNLAHAPHSPDQAQEAMAGGTLPYMAPEQLQAFLDPDAWQTVGAQADLYALGLVLRELVTGVRPSSPPAGLPLDRAIADLRDQRHSYAVSLREARPGLPPSIDAIICKCLAFDREARYASAQELSTDLRCFLQRQPLIGATNPSPLERGFNWVYRQRRVALGVGLGLLVLLFGLLLNSVRFDSPIEVPTLLPDDLLPIKSVRATIDNFDALRDPDFARILNAIHSPSVSDWHQIRQDLLVAMAQHPRSAWPLIYLAQVEFLLDDQKKFPNARHMQGEQKFDAEAASRHCLAWAPAKTPLLMTLGRIASQTSNYSQARGFFREALLIQENHPGIKLELARVASAEKKPDEAIALYQQVVDSDSPPIEDAHRRLIRRNLILLLLDQLDDALRRSSGSDSRERMQWLAQLAEQHLQRLQQEASRTVVGEQASSPHLLDLCWGILDSARAWLDCATSPPAIVEQRFRDASRHLTQALEQVSALPNVVAADSKTSFRTKTLSLIRGHQRILEERITAYRRSYGRSQLTPSTSR